ncbi:hypothetical protein F511_14902 [Dorcoceras hygrometricum]|uniref:Uncharacterized protein n=1 Tax=Dorcoceras hygrometricum TaxID=472368 RepID=A0A2Z7BB16_9LAMI|nr:hypothetical protein F511_14902 [Dorcoceras hygrometricum]
MTGRFLLQRSAIETGRTQILIQHQEAHLEKVREEEVHYLMANQTTDDEVFDLYNSEFTREDLINELNEMVQEYRKLSQTFEEIKAENGCLKNSSVEPTTAQLGETDSLQTELNEMKIENDILRTKSCELSSENERLSQVMSSCTKSSVSLGKLHETQKPLNDKSGLGNFGESSSEGTWLTNRLEKDKVKAGPKSSVPNQQRLGSTKAKSVWVKVQTKRDLNGPSTMPKLNRLLRQPALEGLMRSARTDSPRQVGRNNFPATQGGGGARAATTAAYERREGAAAKLRKSHFPKSSSHAQHIELSIRAGISNPVLV